MQDIAKTLSWTFIHSLWQGLLAALLSAIIISSTRNATARLRYNLLSIVMILFFVGSVITFITQLDGKAKPGITPFAAISDEAQVMKSTDRLMDNFVVWVNASSDIIMVIWIFFFLLSFLRLITGLAAVHRLRHYKTHPVTTDWKTKLEQLQRMIGVRCSVFLLQSELVKVPMVFGILKPVIFLPLGLLTHLPAEQVETILLHELAHIRRRDYLVNLLQHIAEAIFFFNPAIRWISSLIRQEREASCDDIVVASCKQKTDYLNALINFHEYSFNHSSYVMGISGKRHYLLNRVKRIITNKNKGINFFEKIALLAGVLLFSAFSFITKEKDVKSKTVKPDSYQVQQPATEVLPIIVSKSEHPSIEKKKINHRSIPVTDTVPGKKNAVQSKSIDDKKPVTKLNDREQAAKDAEATLQEIIQIKNQIGLKKESIGVMKEQLKTKDGQEKEKILNEIERERDEINGKRRELNVKREQWESLKEKVKAKQMEEKHSDAKTIIDDEKIANKNNNEAKRQYIDEAKMRYINDGKGWRVKTRPVSTVSKENYFKIDNSILNKQEYQYKMDLQLKDPPPAKPRAAPENLKVPGAPAKKAAPVRS